MQADICLFILTCIKMVVKKAFCLALAFVVKVNSTDGPRLSLPVSLFFCMGTPLIFNLETLRVCCLLLIIFGFITFLCQWPLGVSSKAWQSCSILITAVHYAWGKYLNLWSGPCHPVLARRRWNDVKNCLPQDIGCRAALNSIPHYFLWLLFWRRHERRKSMRRLGWLEASWRVQFLINLPSFYQVWGNCFATHIIISIQYILQGICNQI